jgi:hypothetical protein
VLEGVRLKIERPRGVHLADLIPAAGQRVITGQSDLGVKARGNESHGLHPMPLQQGPHHFMQVARAVVEGQYDRALRCRAASAEVIQQAASVEGGVVVEREKGEIGFEGIPAHHMIAKGRDLAFEAVRASGEHKLWQVTLERSVYLGPVLFPRLADAMSDRDQSKLSFLICRPRPGSVSPAGGRRQPPACSRAGREIGASARTRAIMGSLDSIKVPFAPPRHSERQITSSGPK